MEGDDFTTAPEPRDDQEDAARREVPERAKVEDDKSEIREQLDPGQIYGGQADVAGAEEETPAADEDGVG